MPTVYDPNNEEQTQGTDASGQSSSSGSSGGEAVNVSPTSTQQSPGAPKAASGEFGSKAGTSSGRFVNIQNYINANKQGAQGLAQGVSQNIGSNVNQAKSDLGTAQAQNTNDLNTVDSTVKQAQKDARGAAQSLDTQSTSDTTVPSPQRQANQDILNQKTQQIQQGLNTDYQTQLKKQQFNNQQGLTNQAQNLKDTGQQVTTEGGKQALLNQYYGRPDYTGGQSALDTALLGSSKQNQDTLNQARLQTRQFDPLLQNALQNYTGQKTNIQTGLDSGVTALRGNVSNLANDLYSNLQGDVGTYNNRQQQATQNIDQGVALAQLQQQGYKVDYTPGQTQSDASAMIQLGNGVTVPLSVLLGGGSGQPQASYVDPISGQTLHTAVNGVQNPFSATFQNATENNVDPEKLARVNALRSLAGQAPIVAGDALNTNLNYSTNNSILTGLANNTKQQAISEQVNSLNREGQQLQNQINDINNSGLRWQGLDQTQEQMQKTSDANQNVKNAENRIAAIQNLLSRYNQ